LKLGKLLPFPLELVYESGPLGWNGALILLQRRKTDFNTNQMACRCATHKPSPFR
jgi:hypothetical protein